MAAHPRFAQWADAAASSGTVDGANSIFSVNASCSASPPSADQDVPG
jgi:hypothetical protein